MKPEKKDIQTTFHAWAQEQSLQPLDEADIRAFREGSLSEQERLDLLERAAFDDASLIRLLDSDPDPAADESEETDRAWMDFQQRLSKQEPAALTSPFASYLSPFRLTLAAAALVLISVLGTLAVSRASRPVVVTRARVVDLFFKSSMRNGESDNQDLAGVQVVTTRLHLPDEWQQFRQFQVAVNDRDGRQLLLETVGADENRVITLSLYPRNPQTTGVYTITISGFMNGEWRQLGQETQLLPELE